MRAEDRLPDAVNESLIDGVVVRKGTVGAFLANARVWSDRTSSDEARTIAERDIVGALPALRALGLFDVLNVRETGCALSSTRINKRDG
jgi:hypothetical protein